MKKIALIVVGLLICVGMIVSLNFSKEKNENVAEWTCVFYFDADNNLAEYNEMITDLEFLEKAGSSENVNLVVLLDRNLTNDSHSYYILKGGLREIPLNKINPEWKNEVNMGDPNTLISFGEYCMDNYPALHYNFMLSDHGGGWYGVCWDDTNDDHITMEELKNSFITLKNYRGGNIEVLSLSACLMGMTEVAYQLKDSVDYFVASESYGYGSENTSEGGLLVGNWQFDKVWGALVNDPGMSPEGLCAVMIDYFNPYGPWTARPFIPKEESSDCMSAIDLSVMDELAAAVDEFAKDLSSKLPLHRPPITYAIQNTQSFSGQLDFIGLSYFPIYDLYDFAYEISNVMDVKSANDVMDAVENAVVKETHGNDASNGEHPDAHGLSIYLPQRATEYDDRYENLDFAKNTGWDVFLKKYILIE